MSTVYLFHFTDPWSLDAIVHDGYIGVTYAGHKHAHYGTGVYLTTLGPRTNRQRLIYNNYRVDNAHPDTCPNLWSKTSAYVRIPIDDLPQVERIYDDPDRIIYVNRQPIYLDHVRYQTGIINDDDDDDDDDGGDYSDCGDGLSDYGDRDTDDGDRDTDDGDRDTDYDDYF